MVHRPAWLKSQFGHQGGLRGGGGREEEDVVDPARFSCTVEGVRALCIGGGESKWLERCLLQPFLMFKIEGGQAAM